MKETFQTLSRRMTCPVCGKWYGKRRKENQTDDVGGWRHHQEARKRNPKIPQEMNGQIKCGIVPTTESIQWSILWSSKGNEELPTTTWVSLESTLSERSQSQKAICFLTQYCSLGGFDNRNVLSHGSGGWKSKIKVSAGLISSGGHEGEPVGCPSPSVWWLAGNLWHSLVCRSITLIPTLIFTWRAPCVQISPFYKVISRVGLRPTLTTSAELIAPARTLFPNKVTF
nr:uncharacterized protein LOC118545533 isoform X3 [Halichoerus grypus]